MIRIIVAGSRNFHNHQKMYPILDELLKDKTHDEIELVSGCCRGADKLGELYGYYNNWKVIKFQADWDKYGKAAGAIRNEQMAKYASEAERGILIAFPIGESRGTYNMIKLAKQYGLEVMIYKEDEN